VGPSLQVSQCPDKNLGLISFHPFAWQAVFARSFHEELAGGLVGPWRPVGNYSHVKQAWLDLLLEDSSAKVPGPECQIVSASAAGEHDGQRARPTSAYVLSVARDLSIDA